MNPNDEWLRTMFKVEEEFIELHGTSGLNNTTTTTCISNYNLIIYLRYYKILEETHRCTHKAQTRAPTNTRARACVYEFSMLL